MWSREQQTFPKSGAVRDYLMVALGRLELTGLLHSAESGKGSELLEDAYVVTVHFEPDGWQVSRVLDNGAESPLMRFSHPEAYEYFYADTGRGTDEAVELYTEMRFTGTLRTISDQLPIADRSEATLVLQGLTTTWCMELSNFDHWILLFDVRRGDVVEHAAADGAVQGGADP